MDDCLFCKLVKKEVPTDIIYEDEFVMAFNDFKPQAPVHFLVIPKAHIDSAALINSENSDNIARVFEAIAKIAKQKNLKDGFRVVTNCGKLAEQTIFHIHYHVLSGRDMTWPPG